MNIKSRVELLAALGNYLDKNDQEFQTIKEKANRENAWFIPDFIDVATKNISNQFLNEKKLYNWINKYNVPEQQTLPKQVGIVMAGNIPLVVFHDMLCVFISGHKAIIKPSSKDEVLIKHLAGKLVEWDASVA